MTSKHTHYHDESGRGFLLGYISLLQNEIKSLQGQLDRYAADFRSLLAADDDSADMRPRQNTGLQMGPPHRRMPTESYVSAVSALCSEIASRLGQSPQYCAQLSGSARSALTRPAQVAQVGSGPDSHITLEGALQIGAHTGSPSDGTSQPLAARIYAAAEYAASITAPDRPAMRSGPLAESDLSVLSALESSHRPDIELVDVLLQILGEKEEGLE